MSIRKRCIAKTAICTQNPPVVLTRDDENYYLVTYKEEYGIYTHCRVDKIETIEITEDEPILFGKFFDLSAYSKKMFKMFTGEESDVSIEFENELVGVVFESFGTHISIVEEGESRFMCRVKVAVSPHFLSWIMSFGIRQKYPLPTMLWKRCIHLQGELREFMINNEYPRG